MSLMNYRTYCEAILLTEENQKEVFERLHKVFPEEAEYRIYSAILNLFPSLNAKSIITSVLIRTKVEREKTNINPSTTKEVFDQLVELLKRNVKVDLAAMLKKDRTDHPLDDDSQLFTGFTELVHQYVSKIAAVDQRRLQKRSAVHITKSDDEEETITTKYPNPIYTDDEIEIYQSKSPGQCAVYQKDSGICLKYAYHFWGTYRIPYESAFYYVFPKSPREVFQGGPIAHDTKVGLRGKEGNHRFLLVEVRKDNRGVWAYEDNVMNYYDDLNQLKSLFPFLIKAIESNVFKKYPLSKHEEENYQLVQDKVNDSTFLNFPPEVKDMYIANQHDLTDRQWNMLSKIQKNDCINFCINKDLSDYQYEDVKKDSQLYKRYVVIKKRSLEDKIKSGEFTKNGITKHESAILPNLLSGFNETQKATISGALVKGMKDILTGKVQPKNDVSGIYNLFKGQLLADPSMQSNDVLLSIADILGGGKTKAWKTLPPEVKNSVYSVATDLYNANPQKLQSLINDKIGRDTSVLLQGLVDVPTSFQAEYFNEHKLDLLNNEEFNLGLTQELKSHLVYGTDFPSWLKNYWNTDKSMYLKDPEFVNKIKFDFQNVLYGHEKNNIKLPDYRVAPEETKELLNKFINDIRQDPESLSIVQQTLYDLVMLKSADMDEIDTWPVSDEYKKYFKEHEKGLGEWITYKIIDTPPDNKPPSIIKTIEKYKNIVLSDPRYSKLIEDRLVNDIVTSKGIGFTWSGTRIEYWLQHFWNIMTRYPGIEKQLVERMKQEYGTDRTANAFYTEYGIPYEFYKKHEAEILSDPEAYRGLKEKVIEPLQWRDPKDATDEEAAKRHLSKIERDFYYTHKKEFPPSIIGADKRGS